MKIVWLQKLDVKRRIGDLLGVFLAMRDDLVVLRAPLSNGDVEIEAFVQKTEKRVDDRQGLYAFCLESNNLAPTCGWGIQEGGKPLDEGRLYILKHVGGFGGTYFPDADVPLYGLDGNTLVRLDDDETWVWHEGYPHPYTNPVAGTLEQAKEAWSEISGHAGEDLNPRDKFMAHRGKSNPYPASFEEFASPLREWRSLK